jgi:hypothetical protein
MDILIFCIQFYISGINLSLHALDYQNNTKIHNICFNISYDVHCRQKIYLNKLYLCADKQKRQILKG